MLGSPQPIHPFQQALALVALLTCTFGCCEPERTPDLGEAVVVDGHAHLFRSSDLPIEKFLVNSQGVPESIAKLVECVIRRIEGDPDKLAEPEQSINDEQAVWILEQTLEDNPDLVPSKYEEVESEDKGLISWSKTAIRYVKWAYLMTLPGKDIAKRYIADTPQAHLSIVYPMDMWYWFEEEDAQPSRDFDAQVEQLSSLSKLHRGKFAPFYHFNPRRWAADPHLTMKKMEDRVLRDGFVGVKIYPALGYLPENNQRLIAKGVFKSQAEAEQIDAAMVALFDFCAKHDVPIATHCEDPGAELDKAKEFGTFGNPTLWKPILDRYQAKSKPLRICFLHFGGEHHDLLDEEGNRWPQVVFELMKKHPHVYADVGAHAWYENNHGAYLDELFRLSQEPGGAVMTERLMLGTDWHMTVRHEDHRKFIPSYVAAYESRFGVEAARRFAGRNALEFMGITNGENRSRLAAFYGNDLPKWWPDEG